MKTQRIEKKSKSRKQNRQATQVAQAVAEVEATMQIQSNGTHYVGAPDTSHVEADFPPYDAEAWEWMSAPIPGAYSPILYVGTAVSVKISQLLGRPMTLQEAQHIVQADGDIVTCASEATQFQAVKYLPFVPRDLGQQIKDGKALTDIELPYGGAFYVNGKQEPVGISGSVFRHNPQINDYEFAHTSPLVVAAEEFRKRTGKMRWGVPYEVAARIQKAREVNNARRTRIARLISGGEIQITKPLGRGRDDLKRKH